MKNLLKYIILLVFTSFFLACGDAEEELPAGVIVEDNMIEVITEIELTQALVKLKFSNQDSTVNQQQLFNEVYRDFNVSEEQFNSSLAYYCKDPKLLEGMYVKVINNLSEKQAEIQK